MSRLFSMTLFVILCFIGLPLMFTGFFLEKTKVPVLISLLLGLSLNIVYLLVLVTQIFKN